MKHTLLEAFMSISAAIRRPALGTCLVACLVLPGQAQTPETFSDRPAPVSYAAALSGGRAFTFDADDPDPAGSYSVSGSLERRVGGRALSTGIEAGFHRFLIIDQDLSPDVTGWASRLTDERSAWRVTPFLRWRTRGDLSLYAQLGAGLYLQRTSYFQQERQAGEVVYATEYAATKPGVGVNLGLGLELHPGGSPLGLAIGVRSHAVRSGDGFNTAEIAIVWRGRRRASAH